MQEVLVDLNKSSSMSKKVAVASIVSKRGNKDKAHQGKSKVLEESRASNISGDNSPKRLNLTSPNNAQPMPGKVAKRIKIFKTLLPYFQAQYPKCFTIPQSPLAIGIGKLIIEKESPAQTEADIKKFLSMYVNTITYNESIIEGVSRINLSGEGVSIIGANDADFAKAKVVAIKAARSRRGDEIHKTQQGVPIDAKEAED
jgi:hypothetical protein